jgi:hypothetical protein
MWFDGADLRSMFTDTAGTNQVPGTATASNNRIRLWRDKSGMGNNLTGVNDDNSPTLTISSTNPQRFDVDFSANRYISNTAIINNSNTYTKIFVFRRDNTGVSTNQFQRVFSYGTTTGDFNPTDPTGFHFQSAGNQTTYLGYKSNIGTGNFTLALDTYHIVTIVASPLTMSIFLNGSSTAAVTLTLPNTNFNATTFRLGTNFFQGNNSYWPGRINEVISYNRQLSTYEYQEVEGYLAWKWGLLLPAAHPFNRFQTPALTPFQPELQLYKPTFDVSDLNPIMWIDPQDSSSIKLDTTTNRILTIKSKINPTRSITDVPITLVSVTSTSFTVSLSSGLVIGSSIVPLATVAGTPGLTANTQYFIASISGNVVTLASSLANARSGTAISGFTTNASLNVTANVTLSVSSEFTILSVTSNIFTISSPNGLTIGTEIISEAVAGTPGLVANTVYFVSLISGNTIRIASSLANAFNGIHMSGFTNNASLDVIVYYTFCLSKPSSIDGPLLATSSVSSGPSLKYMECLNGGVFKLSSAEISGTTLTLTTEIPHNIPAGRQITLNILNGIYAGSGSPSVTTTAMGPFNVTYASVSGGAGTILTLNTSVESAIAPASSVYLQANTATYNAGSGATAVDLTAAYTVPANISITANSSSSTGNVVTMSSVVGLAIGQGIRFTSTFGGIPINTTHYINSISGNNITISTLPFGVNRTLTTSATGSSGTAGTFGFAIVLTLPIARTVGPIQLGDISIRNNGGLVGPYIVATSGTPNANTLTVTTYSTLLPGLLQFLVGRIEYGSLSLSSANLTSTTSMTMFTSTPHGLNNTDTFSTSFIYLIRPHFSTTFTTATVNAAGNLLTITGLSNTTIFTASGLSSALFLPAGTTFANGVQASSLSGLNILTQSGTNGTTVTFSISTATANQGNLSFVTGESGAISINPFTGGNSADLNANLYTVTVATTNSFTFTTPSQPGSGKLRGQNASESFISSSSSNSSFVNFPVNGYALENTRLGGALVSRFITMVYVSHLIRAPIRSTLLSFVQSSIIATSVTVDGGGGADTGLGGRDYRIQASFNAGTSRFQLKHNNVGINQNPTYNSDFTSTASPFRVHSMIINTTNTNISDIAALTKYMAINGWRYSNVTTSDREFGFTATITTSATVSTVTGLISNVGFLMNNIVTKIEGAGAFGTNSRITAINASGTAITVTGDTSHTAGSISFRVTPTNSLLNGSFAAGVGNLKTTSYLRPTHLRIGGDTAATTNYSTFPLCGSWYEGGIGDIIIFNSILSIEERQLVEGFLAQKYNTAGTLGGTTVSVNTSFIHPYRVNTTIVSPSLDLTKTYAQGLAMWFDAANSSTIQFSSGSLVSSWSSAGGNISGLALIKTTPANQPTLENNVQNGLPGMKFIRGAEDGGTFPNSSNLTTASTFNMNQFTTISSNNEYTNFMVVKFTVDPDNGHTAMVIVSSNDRPYLIKGNLVEYRAGFSQNIVYSPDLDVNTPYIITITRRGSTGRAIIVGNNARNITETSFAENVQITGSFTRVTMGGYGPNPAGNNDAFEGYIHEFVGFRYALTDQAIYQMEGYLAWKWGLQLSLSETHPYRRIRP